MTTEPPFDSAEWFGLLQCVHDCITTNFSVWSRDGLRTFYTEDFVPYLTNREQDNDQ